MLHRYGGNLSIFEIVDFASGNDIIINAMKQDEQDKLFQRWTAGGWERAGVQFNQYRSAIIKTDNKNYTADEILNNVAEILDKTTFVPNAKGGENIGNI